MWWFTCLTAGALFFFKLLVLLIHCAYYFSVCKAKETMEKARDWDIKRRLEGAMGKVYSKMYI